MIDFHQFETRSAAAGALEEAGITGPAAEHLLNATGGHRHALRVDRAWEAALEAVAHECAAACVLLAAELAGIGGRFGGTDGAGTARQLWAQRLGKGRRQAPDGAAWDAAIETALKRQCRSMSPTSDGGIAVELWDVHRATVVLVEEVAPCDLPQGSWPWVLSLAAQALRACLGLEGATLPKGLRRGYGPNGSTVSEAANWAAVFNNVQQLLDAAAYERQCGEELEEVHDWIVDVLTGPMVREGDYVFQPTGVWSTDVHRVGGELRLQIGNVQRTLDNPHDSALEALVDTWDEESQENKGDSARWPIWRAQLASWGVAKGLVTPPPEPVAASAAEEGYW